MLKERIESYFNIKNNDFIDISKLYSIDNRDKWDRIDDDTKKLFIEEADKLIDMRFEPISIKHYDRYNKDGNRSEHASIYFSKRKKLQLLVIAECIINTGKYIDTIADGIWSICEESTWLIPATIYQIPGGEELKYPDMTRPYIDLFVADTGATLAFVYKILESSLKLKHNHILKRIKYEVNKRILNPYLEHRDFWWMCYKESNAHIINNWNPMCTSHVIEAFLLIEEDTERLKKALFKAFESLDIFLQSYDIDGGCDEGTSYWRIAGGSLFDALEAIYVASDGFINLYSEKLIYNIGDYICKMAISKNRYVNFADGSALLEQSFELLYNYGRRINNENMIKLAFLTKDDAVNQMINENITAMARLLRGVFSLDKFEKDSNPLKLKSEFLQGINVMVARERQELSKGWFLASKAGHNDESHNHNDVGSFVIYLDGSPMIIDLGVLEYTKNTFNEHRYEIYTMQSSFHNTPIINGYEQMQGKDYRANNVKYLIKEDYEMMHCDIKDAYPNEAEIDFWVRTIERKKSIIKIIDQFELKEIKGITSIIFMTPNEPEVKENCMVINGLDNTKAYMIIDNEKLKAEIEKVCIPKDANLTPVWGERVFKIRIMPIKTTKECKIEIEFSKKLY